jgi:hypothetical protein
MPAKMAFADADTVPPGPVPAITAQWWQWALSLPTDQNPQLDMTGENCDSQADQV